VVDSSWSPGLTALLSFPSSVWNIERMVGEAEAMFFNFTERHYQRAVRTLPLHCSSKMPPLSINSFTATHQDERTHDTDSIHTDDTFG